MNKLERADREYQLSRLLKKLSKGNLNDKQIDLILNNIVVDYDYLIKVYFDKDSFIKECYNFIDIRETDEKIVCTNKEPRILFGSELGFGFAKIVNGELMETSDPYGFEEKNKYAFHVASNSSIINKQDIDKSYCTKNNRLVVYIGTLKKKKVPKSFSLDANKTLQEGQQ